MFNIDWQSWYQMKAYTLPFNLVLCMQLPFNLVLYMQSSLFAYERIFIKSEKSETKQI